MYLGFSFSKLVKQADPRKVTREVLRPVEKITAKVAPELLRPVGKLVPKKLQEPLIGKGALAEKLIGKVTGRGGEPVITTKILERTQKRPATDAVAPRNPNFNTAGRDPGGMKFSTAKDATDYIQSNGGKMVCGNGQAPRFHMGKFICPFDDFRVVDELIQHQGPGSGIAKKMSRRKGRKRGDALVTAAMQGEGLNLGQYTSADGVAYRAIFYPATGRGVWESTTVQDLAGLSALGELTTEYFLDYESPDGLPNFQALIDIYQPAPTAPSGSALPPTFDSPVYSTEQPGISVPTVSAPSLPGSFSPGVTSPGLPGVSLPEDILPVDFDPFSQLPVTGEAAVAPGAEGADYPGGESASAPGGGIATAIKTAAIGGGLLWLLGAF